VINPEQGWILMEDESEALIDLYIDQYGCAVEDPEDAIAVVARYTLPLELFGRFLLLDIRGFGRKEFPDELGD
jgi:hypothetical protein